MRPTVKVFVILTITSFLIVSGFAFAVAQTDDRPRGKEEATATDEPAAEPATSSPAAATMIMVRNPLYNHDKPLLFDSGTYQDNSSCLVCHIDLQEEPIAAKHEAKGITCAGCHGDSLTHSGDEFNIIRPDVIWGRAEIAPFCRQCHKQHEHPDKVKQFRAQWLGKRRENGRYVLEDSACTDCHGRHAVMRGEGNFK